MLAKFSKKQLVAIADGFRRSWWLVVLGILGSSLFIIGAVRADINQTKVIIEIADCNRITGFAKDYSRITEPVMIRVSDTTGDVIFTGFANSTDPVLLSQGFPWPDHGFRIAVPNRWKTDGLVHTIVIEVLDSDGNWYTFDYIGMITGEYAWLGIAPVDHVGPCSSPPVVYTPGVAINGPSVLLAGQTTNIQYFATNNGTVNGPGYHLRLEESDVGGGFYEQTNSPQTTGLNVGQSTLPRPSYIFTAPNVSGQYCFRSTVKPNPGSQSGPSPQVCVTVNAVSQPFIQTNGSDVHAGDCTSPLGNIKVNSGALGDSIISSAGSITAPGGTYTSIPTYGQICRPNLVTAAQSVASPPGTNGVAGAVTDGQVYTLTNYNGGTNRYILAAGNTNVKTTIYSAGNLQITGNLSAGNTGALGIIVNGDVYIDPGVTTLTNVYIFATGTIYTCGDNTFNFTSKPTVTACKNTLTLRGLLSGGGFVFGRTGGDVATGVPSENLGFQPAVYLITPPLFDGSLASGLINTFTEKPPLY